MTKHEILSYLNILRKPTSIDPQQKWIISYNNRLRYYAKFFRLLYNKEEPDYRKRISPSCIHGLERKLLRSEFESSRHPVHFFYWGKLRYCFELDFGVMSDIFSNNTNESGADGIDVGACPLCSFSVSFELSLLFFFSVADIFGSRHLIPCYSGHYCIACSIE